MGGILQKIKEYKLEEIKLAKLETPISLLEKAATEKTEPLSFGSTLRKNQKESFGIISEIKKASPSKGMIRSDFNVGKIAQAYEAGGASCLSILTDFPSFMGQKNHIMEARDKSALPILRKDFLYDPYQVVETRAIGADCILIIMASVSDQQASELEETAIFWGLDVLIEVHNEKELERALKLKSKLIGINNRDLKTFNVRIETTLELAIKVPREYLIIAESGIKNKNDIKQMAKVNVRSFLIGESLMKAKNIETSLRKLLL